MANNLTYSRQSTDGWSESGCESYASDFSSPDDSSLIDEALDESANGTFPDVSLILDQLNDEEMALDDVQRFLAENTPCLEVNADEGKVENFAIARIQPSLLDSPPSPTESVTSTNTESLSSSSTSCCFPRSPRRQNKKKGGSTKQTLPGFMCSAIQNSDLNPSAIRWLNEEERIFLIVKPKTIAELWGARKGNPKMNYPSMSRGIRERRKYGYFDRVPQDSRYPKKLTYKFGPKANQYLS